MKNSKIFKILLVGIILLTSIQTYAFNSCSDEDLIEKMSVDEDVNQLLELSVKTALVYGIGGEEINNFPDEAKDKINSSINKISEYKETIENKYPEYSAKSSEEKRTIMARVSEKNAFGSYIKQLLKCTAAEFAAYGVCLGATAYWRSVAFTACITGNALGDIALTIASGGGNAPAIQLELEAGTFACARVIYGFVGEECTVAFAVAVTLTVFGACNV